MENDKERQDIKKCLYRNCKKSVPKHFHGNVKYCSNKCRDLESLCREKEKRQVKARKRFEENYKRFCDRSDLFEILAEIFLVIDFLDSSKYRAEQYPLDVIIGIARLDPDGFNLANKFKRPLYRFLKEDGTNLFVRIKPIKIPEI